MRGRYNDRAVTYKNLLFVGRENDHCLPMLAELDHVNYPSLMNTVHHNLYDLFCINTNVTIASSLRTTAAS